MSLRNITKNRGSFPSDEALIKLFYLVLRNICQKRTMPIRDWKAGLTRFTIQFEDRMNNLYLNHVYIKSRTRPFPTYVVNEIVTAYLAFQAMTQVTWPLQLFSAMTS